MLAGCEPSKRGGSRETGYVRRGGGYGPFDAGRQSRKCWGNGQPIAYNEAGSVTEDAPAVEEVMEDLQAALDHLRSAAADHTLRDEVRATIAAAALVVERMIAFVKSDDESMSSISES